jgi:hypothetical protein
VSDFQRQVIDGKTVAEAAGQMRCAQHGPLL